MPKVKGSAASTLIAKKGRGAKVMRTTLGTESLVFVRTKDTETRGVDVAARSARRAALVDKLIKLTKDSPMAVSVGKSGVAFKAFTVGMPASTATELPKAKIELIDAHLRHR